MTIPSPAPVSVVASLLRVASLPAPGTPTRHGHEAAIADPITLSQDPPGADALWTMASSGLRNMAALLPVLDRAILAPQPAPEDLGHLAQVIGAAAHQIGTGFGAVLESHDPARPSPAALDGWRGHAAQTLDNASDVLQRAEQAVACPMSPAPAALWAMSEVVRARRQVGAARRHIHTGLADALVTTKRRPAWLGSLILTLLGELAAALAFGAEGLGVALLATAGWGVWVRRVALPQSRLRLALDPAPSVSACDAPWADPKQGSAAPPSVP